MVKKKKKIWFNQRFTARQIQNMQRKYDKTSFKNDSLRFTK